MAERRNLRNSAPAQNSRHLAEELKPWLIESQQRLADQFYSRGPVQLAFSEICEAGFQADVLEQYLVDLAKYPIERTKRLFSSKDLRRLDRIISDLKKAGRELRQFDTLMYLGGQRKWPIEALRVPQLLCDISDCIASARASRFAKRSNQPNASSKIRILVEEIRRETGRPHYEAMATLIGAVYRDPDFSEEHLKTMISRGRKRSSG